MTKAIKCLHEWVGGVCSKCDHQYDPKESEYTVIFDWSAESWSADDAIPVVVLATKAGLAQDRAQELLLATHHDLTEDDFNWVITFHGDISNLVAE